MPYTRRSKNKSKKNKKQTTKKTVNESVRQKKLMQARLMILNLKADDYIYKKKPISIQDAYAYKQEMEVFKNQCQDERFLQVIEKLTSYMKCIIREQSPNDIADAKIIDPIRNPIEEINDKNEHDDATVPEYNTMIDIEMERSLSNLSIVEVVPKDPLAISDTNDNGIYQKKAKMDHSTSAITKKNLNEDKNRKVAFPNKELDILTPVDQKQKDIVDDSDEFSQNILSNFEYENYTSSRNLRNYRNPKNKPIKQTFKDVTPKITDNNNNSIGTNTNKSEIGNQSDIHQNEKEIVDDSCKLSQNLLNDFENVNFSGAVELQNNTKPKYNQTRHGNEIASNIVDAIDIAPNYNNIHTGNRHTKLEEVINLNTVKQKERSIDGNKLSQNIRRKFDNPKNYQPLYVNEISKNLIDGHKVINFSNTITNTEKSNTNLKVNTLNAIQPNEKEVGGESNELSQNLSNFEYESYAVDINHTNSKNYQTKQKNGTHCTSKDNTFSKSNQIQHTFPPSKFYDIQDNTIVKSNTQNNFVTPKMNQQNIKHNGTQNQENVNDKVKKRRKTLNKDIVKNAKKRTNCRKTKVSDVTTARSDLSRETVHSVVQEAKNPENSVKYSKQKNQRTFLKKKREVSDISWVENMKFVREIETDEYFKFDNLEESFWSDMTLPSDLSVIDFEYDNINIWKN